jgi:TonB-linked SusC/RagA family outer membrane protein
MKIKLLLKKITPLYLIIMAFSFNAFSQSSQLKGTIVDSTGVAIRGASIKIKGASSGTTSDANGDFTINYQGTAKIEISSIGYTPRLIPINGKQTIKVVLQSESKGLNEVVVTALGIKREKRLLTYATQEIKGDEIMETKQPNVLNALDGKLAGVQITSSTGGPGASVNVVIRGAISISGNNQALIVLDGVPIDNSETGIVNSGASGAGSSRISDIDPNTIESVNVLKGAAATTLYGSAGARGVILITTKSGSRNKKPVVTFSSDFSFDNAILPKRQTDYAQGTNGIFYSGNDAAGKISTSWGPAMDTLKINGVPAKKYDPYSTFFKTGHSSNNAVSVEGGGEKSSYFVSYSYLDQTGTEPNNDFKRNTLFTKFTNSITDNLNFTFQLGYTNSDQDRLPEGSSNGPLFTLFSEPVSWNPYPYENADGTQRLYRNSRNNPLWAAANESNHYNVNRFTPVMTLNFTPTKWLTITERGGADIYGEQDKYWENPSVNIGTLGEIIDQNNNFRQFNNDLIANATKQFGKFNVNFLVGNNILSTYNQSYYELGSGLTIPGYYNIAGASTVTASESHSLERKIGFYSQANIEYNRFLSLNLTGRYDGSSVLSTAKDFYPYGSVATGFIFSELLSPELSKVISYGKLRLSYASVGNDNVGAYVLNTPYVPADVNGIQFPYQGQAGLLVSSNYGNPYLQNERLNEAETGLEMKFLNNRLGFDFSYYNRKTTDGLISAVGIAPSTGYATTTVNSASLRNKGVEALLTGTPIKAKDFQWDANLNFSLNRSRVLSLYKTTDQLGRIIVGQPYDVFYGTRYARNSKGQLLIGDDGLPEEASTQGVVGNPNPNWTAGLTNSFRYKNVTFSFMFDVKDGGDIENDVDLYGDYYGTSYATENRAPRVIDGVNATTGKPNTVSVGAQTYYQYINSIYEASIQDGTYIKLRNVSLSYNLNKDFLKKTPFKAVSISATANNLWIYSPHFTGADPEVSSYGTGNTVWGIYAFSTPSSRSYIFSIKASF